MEPENEHEIKVIKQINRRENALMKLSDISYLSESPNAVSEMLSLLSQIRESTLHVIDTIVLWRKSCIESQTSGNHNEVDVSVGRLSPSTVTAPLSGSKREIPVPFIWKGTNYLIKLIHDLNFITENKAFVASLGLPLNKLIHNPLMLPNNLHDKPSFMDPTEMACFDAGGRREGSIFEERLRLRRAEIVLRLEIQLQGHMISPVVKSLNDSVIGSSNSLSPNNIKTSTDHNNNNTVTSPSNALITQSTSSSSPSSQLFHSLFAMTLYDLQCLEGIRHPSHQFQLATACCMIFLSPGLEVSNKVRDMFS